MSDQGPVAVIAGYKFPWKLPPPSDLDAIFANVSSAVMCKHPSWNSQVDNSNDHILKAYAIEQGLCIPGPQQPTYLATTGTMDVLDIAILKDIGLTMTIEALHELSSDYLPVILELGERRTQRRRSSAFLPTRTNMQSF
jgi:hypothetical protein